MKLVEGDFLRKISPRRTQRAQRKRILTTENTEYTEKTGFIEEGTENANPYSPQRTQRTRRKPKYLHRGETERTEITFYTKENTEGTEIFCRELGELRQIDLFGRGNKNCGLGTRSKAKNFIYIMKDKVILQIQRLQSNH